jgi:hypothetical protein
MHPSEADSWRLITAQLPGRRGEPLIQCPGALRRKRLVQLLALLFEVNVGRVDGCLVGQARIPESEDRHCRGGSHPQKGRNGANPGRFNGGVGFISDEHTWDVPGQ